MVVHSGVARPLVCRRAYVFVAGGLSGIVVVDDPVGVTGSYGPVVPSTPVVGCGEGSPRPCPAGVSLLVAGAFVIVDG